MDETQQRSSNHIDILSDGKYVVRFDSESLGNSGIAVSFEITAGLNRGQKVVMLLNSKKAQKATQVRRSGWIDWLAYDGDAKATAINHAISNAVSGQFLVRVKSGQVSSILDPISTNEQIYRQFSKEWIISNNDSDWQESFKSCKQCYLQLDRLPLLNGEWPGENRLRNWINAAIKEGGPYYHQEVKEWYDNLYSSLCKEFTSKPQSPHSSLTFWLRNHGFE